MIQGLAESHFEKLTSSSAEPHLKALQELYINFWGEYSLGRGFIVGILRRDAALESQAFSVKRPGQFFNAFSPPRSDAAFISARSKLEEELRFTSKMVSLRTSVLL